MEHQPPAKCLGFESQSVEATPNLHLSVFEEDWIIQVDLNALLHVFPFIAAGETVLLVAKPSCPKLLDLNL